MALLKGQAGRVLWSILVIDILQNSNSRFLGENVNQF